jgi:hypothetical protein
MDLEFSSWNSFKRNRVTALKRREVARRLESDDLHPELRTLESDAAPWM